MKITGKVLVTSDLSRSSDEAIRQAAELARHADAGLVMCHVMPELFGIRPLFPHLREQDRLESEQVRDVIAGIAEEQLRRVLGTQAPQVEIQVDAGSPHAVLLELEKRIAAGLIVIGQEVDRGAGYFGGVAERVSRHSDCPVLIVSATKGRVVVAATDYSDPALPAVQLGQEEADRLGLPLIVVHAIDLRTHHLNLPEITSASRIHQVIEGARQDARDRMKELAGHLRPEVRTTLREGPVVDEILALAEESDAALLVLGAHGRSGLGRLALGSVAEGVIRRARCSTMVVRLGR